MFLVTCTWPKLVHLPLCHAQARLARWQGLMFYQKIHSCVGFLNAASPRQGDESSRMGKGFSSLFTISKGGRASYRLLGEEVMAFQENISTLEKLVVGLGMARNGHYFGLNSHLCCLVDILEKSPIFVIQIILEQPYHFPMAAFIIQPRVEELLQTVLCYGPSVFITSKFMCQKITPQCSSTGRWVLMEVLRLCWSLHYVLNVLIKRECGSRM